MKTIEILVLGGFGLPIAGLSLYFIAAARRMMREEIERERIRRAAAEPARYDKRRRRERHAAEGARTGACR